MTGLFSVLLVILICFVIFCCWCMIWDSNRFVVQKYYLQTEKLEEEVRFLFLSDLHNKEYGPGNVRLLEEIQKQNPDFILIGGDMLNAKPGASFEKTVSFLKVLSSKYKVYYALGNHEYRARIYPETYGTLYNDFRSALKDTGIRFLDNEHVQIGEKKIWITGLTIDKYYYKRFVKRKMKPGYLESVLGEKSGDQYQILLAHNPDYFRDYAQWKPDLVLSGHVHGGVIKLPFLGGVVAPSLRPFPHYDGGLFEEYGCKMILSRGLGMHTIPVRLFNPGELILVELLPTSE